MTQAEAMEFGVPKERLKEFQQRYHEDVRKAVNRQGTPSAKGFRIAIESMLPMIQNDGALRDILNLTTRLYCESTQQKKEGSADEDHSLVQT